MVRKSVPAGRCGPCCSVAPSGSTTVVSGAMARSSSRGISSNSRRVGFIVSVLAGIFVDRVPVEVYAQTRSFRRREKTSGNANRGIDDVAPIAQRSETFARIRQNGDGDAEVRAGSRADSHFSLAADDAPDAQFAAQRKNLRSRHQS